ncbi:MAG: hypothetical protein RR458_04310 [Clostridia bacterium]
MKKRIIAIVLSVVIALVAFTGCGLMTENPNRVADQAVVTIGQGDFQQIVARRDIIGAYNSYGFIYVQYYQMPLNQVLNMLVNSLTNEKIVVYAALSNLEKVSTSNSKNPNTLYDAYLTTQELNEIAIKTDVAISGAIDNIETANLRKTAGIEAPKYKATPTGFEFTTSVPVDFVGTTSRNSAVAQFTRNLLANDLTFDAFKEQQMISFKTAKVVEKYREQIQNKVNVTDEEVMVRYNTILDKEKEQFAISSDAFAKKLEAVSSNKSFSGDNFILSVPQAGLGFVHSILLQYSAEQQAKIDAWKKEVEAKTMTQEEMDVKKKELLKEVTATDNRIDWLKAYGTKTDLFKDYAFDGKYTEKTVENVQVKDEKGEYAYSELESNKYTVEEFMNKVQNELSATKGNVVDGFQIYNTTNKKDKFLDLIWAYNDDPGMENNLVGYMSENTSFVKEYTDAAKAVVKAGVGSYTLVESPDFGCFVVFCSNAYDKVGQNEYVAAEKETKGTFSYEFYNAVNNSLKENYFSETVSALSASYQKDKKFVNLNEKEFQAIYDMMTQK